jgi:hypothetical protein
MSKKPKLKAENNEKKLMEQLNTISQCNTDLENQITEANNK